jgi:hypothetical protein
VCCRPEKSRIGKRGAFNIRRNISLFCFVFFFFFSDIIIITPTTTTSAGELKMKMKNLISYHGME